jgi:hypothetical protein
MNTTTAVMEPEVSFRDLLEIVRRRRRPLLWGLGTVLATTLALALFLPPVYRSMATILIEQQEVPQDLLCGRTGPGHESAGHDFTEPAGNHTPLQPLSPGAAPRVAREAA